MRVAHMNPKHPPGPSMTLGNHARAGRASPHCLTSSVDATTSDEHGSSPGSACAESRLILKRVSASRSSGEWNDDDFDVLADGVVIGRIMKSRGTGGLAVDVDARFRSSRGPRAGARLRGDARGR